MVIDFVLLKALLEKIVDHELDEMEHEPENLMQPAEEEYEAEPETPRLNTYEQDSLMTDDDPHGHTESPLDETVFTSDIDKTHRLLEEILRHLKSVHRQTLFTEFSLFKVLAGTAQIIVPFCLLISIWFLIDPNKPASSDSPVCKCVSPQYTLLGKERFA